MKRQRFTATKWQKTLLILAVLLSACSPVATSSGSKPASPDLAALGAQFRLATGPQRIQLFSGAVEPMGKVELTIHGTGLAVNPIAPCVGSALEQKCSWIKIDKNFTLNFPIVGKISSAEVQFERSDGLKFLKF